ncbi:MAG: CdaR family protein [Limisphaerales bacterium]
MAKREWIMNDFVWKLFSVILAVVIWLTVHKIREEPEVVAASVSGNTLTYGNLPVLVVSAAADVRDFHVAPSHVTVQVSGPVEVMAVLQANQIHAVVDLTDVHSTVNLKRPVEISTPPGVTLVSVEPPEVGVIIPPVSDKNP